MQWSRGSHRPGTSRSGGVFGPSRGGACRAEGRGEGAGAPWRGGRRGGATAAAHSGWAPLGSAERGAAMFARGSRKRLSGRSVSVGGWFPSPLARCAPPLRSNLWLHPAARSGGAAGAVCVCPRRHPQASLPPGASPLQPRRTPSPSPSRADTHFPYKSAPFPGHAPEASPGSQLGGRD